MKPAYREEGIGLHTKIARLKAASPERPYELPSPTEPNMNPWEDRPGFVFSDIQIPRLPWTGSPPIVLLFKLDHLVPSSFRSKWVTVTLGICSNHYAVIQYYPYHHCPELQSFVPHHSCEHDHLDPTLISEYPKWTEWPIRRKIEDVLSIRFRPAEKLDPNADGLAEVTRLEVDIFDDRERRSTTFDWPW